MPVKLIRGNIPLKKDYRMMTINQYVYGVPNDVLLGYHFDNDLLDFGINNFDLSGTPAGYVNNRKSESNKAIDLTESYVYYTSSEILANDTDDLTISFWIYKTSTKIETANIISISNVTQSVGIFRLNWGFNIFGLRWNDQTTNDTTENMTNACNLNTWYHIVLTMDKTLGKIKLYVNNSLIATSTATYNGLKYYSGGGVLQIGRNTTSSPAYLSGGYIDDLRIYKRVLNLDEIGLLYNE